MLTSRSYGLCLGLAVVLSAPACAQHAPPARSPSAQDSLAVRNALKEALQEAAPALAGPLSAVDPRSLRVLQDTATVLRGVVYHWGVYSPPASGDVVVQALVASVNGAVIPIRRPGDWQRAAASAGWVPGDSAAALAGCAELVRVAGPLRGVLRPPVLYADRSLLQDGSVVGARLLSGRIHEPQVRRLMGASAWEVTAWFLEPGRAAKYRCVFLPEASVSAIEVIAGAGYSRTGP